MVVYFIMMADLLIGTPPTYQGVLPTLLHDHTNPWFLSRWLWITIIACFFEGPLLYLRDLGALLWASTASIACSIFFSLALTAVACVAAWQGKLAHFFVGPDPELTGQGVGGIAVTWVGVLPVIALAFICHFNVLPIVCFGGGDMVCVCVYGGVCVCFCDALVVMMIVIIFSP